MAERPHHNESACPRFNPRPECLSPALQVTLAILIIQKTRQAIVAPLHHVLQDTGQIEAWTSGHVRHG